jgi:hypothetical protein
LLVTCRAGGGDHDPPPSRSLIELDVRPRDAATAAPQMDRPFPSARWRGGSKYAMATAVRAASGSLGLGVAIVRR